MARKIKKDAEAQTATSTAQETPTPEPQPETVVASAENLPGTVEAPKKVKAKKVRVPVKPEPVQPEPVQPERELTADGRPVCQLVVSKRDTDYAYLSARQMVALNSNRKLQGYEGRWVVAPADLDTSKINVRDPSETVTGEARTKAYAEGRRKDREQDEKIAAEVSQKQKAPDTKDASKPAKSKTTGLTKKAQIEWQGHGMCDLLRYCGSRKWDKKVAVAILQGLDMNPGKSTVHIQTKKGEAGENVPALTKGQVSELEALIPAAAAEKPVAKKAAKKAKVG